MNIQKSKETADIFGISFSGAAKIRIRYLIDICGQWDEFIGGNTNGMPALTLQEAFTDIDRLKRYQHRLEHGQSVKQAITDEMVQRAREYPIEQLIDFQRNGVAPAFCHPDKNPSLSWDRKRNRARCFVCDMGFDSIGVLMKRDSYSFVDAVKYFAGGA